MLAPQLLAAEPGDDADGLPDARFPQRRGGLDHFRFRDPFVDLGQDAVAPRFQAEVRHIQPKPVEQLQILDGLMQDIPRGGVDAHPLQIRVKLPDGFQDFDEVGGLDDERVPVAEKDPADAVAPARPFLQVGLDFIQAPHPEFFIRVHIAERASVPGTADGHLNEQAFRLRRRPENNSFVLHDIESS